MRDISNLNRSKVGNGWEICIKPISNYDIMVMDAQAEVDDQFGGTCTYCEGAREYIGKLGNREIFRCRNCGVIG